MQLIYRGNTYNYDPSRFTVSPFQMVRNPGSAYDLIYRGVTYRVDPSAKLKEVPKSTESHKLIYRGLVYFTNRTAQVDAIPELAIAA
jgi:YHS domain-containing protein